MADTYLSFMITDLRYTSTDLRELLRISRFSQSMGSVGDSYDNALAESLWASLKKELVYRTLFNTVRGGEIRNIRLDSLVQQKQKT